jgi:hypothetical protein
LYTNATAPGLISQPGFVQLGQGVRIKPDAGDYLKLNYIGSFQEFFAPSRSTNSFLRWTVDFNHTIDLYGKAKSASSSADQHGPDSCAHVNDKCPDPHTRNKNGSIIARLLLSESINSATSAVPFYFQQTLGGQDINSAMALPSYQAYRYRAPNLLLLQESFEHSIWRPFGFEVHEGPRPGRAHAWGPGIQPFTTHLCGGIHVARGRVPHGSTDVCLGRAGRTSQHLQPEQLAAWRVGAAVAGLIGTNNTNN